MKNSPAINSTNSVIDKATSHSTKPSGGQVAGYPAQAGIQQKQNAAQRTKSLSRSARIASTNWIPACAGMTCRDKSRPTFKATTLLLALAAIGLASLPSHDVYANPQGGQVVAGSAAIVQQTPTKIGITQTTDKAIIDWQKYSIGVNEHVQYYQPSVASVTLNRVVGADPSQILGRLTANGQVFLVNPNGIYFGKNAQIDVAGLVASTHNIRNEDFLAGKYIFNLPGKPGAAVINDGSIHIADTGIAAFVAPSVLNNGVIVAKLGKVMLASANGFTLDFSGDQLITFLVNDQVAQTAFDLQGNLLGSFVENAGRIEAQGGYVLLTAKAAENAIHSVINQTGSIEATTVGTHNGTIILNAGTGSLNVSGTLDASAPNGGDGGYIDTSGAHVAIDPNAKITTAAPFGITGKWLIDPLDYTIAASGGNITGALLSSSLANNNVIIQTSTMGSVGGNGDIFVNDAVSWSSGNVLNLIAERNVNINSNVIGGAGFSATAPGKLTITSTGSVTAGQINYLTDSIILLGSSTATVGGIQIDTISNARAVRIATIKMAGTLSIFPAEMATFLHGNNNYGIHIGGSGPLTVASALSAANVNAGYLNLSGSAITIDAPMLFGTKQLVFQSGSGGVALNSPISSDSFIGFSLSNGGGVSQTSSAHVTGNFVTAQGNGYVFLDQANGGNSIRALAADITRELYLVNDSTPLDIVGGPWNSGIRAYSIGLSTLGDLSLNTPLVATGTGALPIGNVTKIDALCTPSCVRPHIEIGVGGSFYNNVGVGVFTLPTGKFWSLLSANPSTTYLNGLVPSAVTYDAANMRGGDVLLSANRIFYGGGNSPMLTPVQSQLVQQHQNDSMFGLLLAIADGLFTNSNTDPVWVGMYQNGAATAVQRAANDQRNIYDAYTAADIFAQIRAGTLVNNLTDPTWHSIYRNGHALQTQVDANAFDVTYNNYKGKTAVALFNGIVAGDLSTNPAASNAMVWQALRIASQTAVGATAKAAAMADTYNFYKTKDAQTLLAGIYARKFKNDPADPIWRAMYVNGSATPAQIEANRLWDINAGKAAADARAAAEAQAKAAAEATAAKAKADAAKKNNPVLYPSNTEPAGTDYVNYIDTGIGVLKSDRSSVLLQELALLDSELNVTFKGFKYALTIDAVNMELQKLKIMLIKANLDTSEIEDIRFAINSANGSKGGLTRALNIESAKVSSLLGKVGKAAGIFATAVDSADMINKIYKGELEISDVEAYSHGLAVALPPGAASAVALVALTGTIAQWAAGTSMSDSLKTIASSTESITKSVMDSVSLAYTLGQNGKMTREEYRNQVFSLLNNNTTNMNFLRNLYEEHTTGLTGYSESVTAVLYGNVIQMHQVMDTVNSAANEIGKVSMDDYMLLFDNGRKAYENGQNFHALVGSANL